LAWFSPGIKKAPPPTGSRAENEKAPRELPQSLDSFISLLPIIIISAL
jgi:hypothetical protein